MPIDIKIEDNSKDFIKELENRIPVVLEECGLAAERNAKIEVTKSVYDTPESPNYSRTGDLRNRITHATDEKSAYVGTNLEYAPYVEMGTVKMKARPFIKPAVVNHASEYKQIIESRLKTE